MVMTRTCCRAPALAVFAAAALLGTTATAARADALVRSLPQALLQAAPSETIQYVPFGAADCAEPTPCEERVSQEEQLTQAAVALLIFFKPADFPPDFTQKTPHDVPSGPPPSGVPPLSGGVPPSGSGGGGPQTPEPTTLISGLIGIGFAGLYRALKRRKN